MNIIEPRALEPRLSYKINDIVQGIVSYIYCDKMIHQWDKTKQTNDRNIVKA